MSCRESVPGPEPDVEGAVAQRIASLRCMLESECCRRGTPGLLQWQHARRLVNHGSRQDAWKAWPHVSPRTSSSSSSVSMQMAHESPGASSISDAPGIAAGIASSSSSTSALSACERTCLISGSWAVERLNVEGSDACPAAAVGASVEVICREPVSGISVDCLELPTSFVSTGAMTPSASLMLAALLCDTPPSVERPCAARVETHVLYLRMGNFSLTSSMVINFFSLRRRR